MERQVREEMKKLKDKEDPEGIPPAREEGETGDELWVWRKNKEGWQKRLVAATDGACPDQQLPARFRRAAAAMFVGKGHALNCTIKLNTRSQGAQRAEIKGAARWIAWAQVPIELWTDSEQVVNGLANGDDKKYGEALRCHKGNGEE